MTEKHGDYGDYLVSDPDGTIRNALGDAITRLDYEIAEWEAKERVVTTYTSSFTGQERSYCHNDHEIGWRTWRRNKLIEARKRWPDYELALSAPERWAEETKDRYPGIGLAPATEGSFGGPGGQVAFFTEQKAETA